MRGVQPLLILMLFCFICFPALAAITNCEEYDTPSGGQEYCKKCISPSVVSKDRTACLICPSGCETCEFGVCKKCKDGAYLNSNTGTCQACSSNCAQCDSSTCLKCSTKYFIGKSSACESCSDDCEECTSKTVCTKCSADKEVKTESSTFATCGPKSGSSSTVWIIVIVVILFIFIAAGAYYAYSKYGGQSGNTQSGKLSGETGYSPFDAEPGLKPNPGSNPEPNQSNNGGNAGSNNNQNPDNNNPNPFEDNFQIGYEKREGADFNPYVKSQRAYGNANVYLDNQLEADNSRVNIYGNEANYGFNSYNQQQ